MRTASWVRYPMITCGGCHRLLRKAVCAVCRWRRLDSALPDSVQTVNNDHTALTQMFIVTKSHRFKLVLDNPSSHIEKPDPKNERHRIVSAEEWAALQTAAAHPSLACTVGPR